MYNRHFTFLNFTSLDTEAICPSSIQVSVTTSVKEPPAKYSITTYKKRNGAMLVNISYVYSVTMYAQAKSPGWEVAMWLIDEKCCSQHSKVLGSNPQSLSLTTFCSHFLNETYPAGQHSANWNCYHVFSSIILHYL